jgi:hypothetical protein
VLVGDQVRQRSTDVPDHTEIDLDCVLAALQPGHLSFGLELLGESCSPLVPIRRSRACVHCPLESPDCAGEAVPRRLELCFLFVGHARKNHQTPRCAAR